MLDCGHNPSPHSEISTGIAHSLDGRRLCYDCAFQEEVRQYKQENRMIAYLSDDGRRITNWPGYTISAQVFILNESRDNFGGERIYLRFVFDDSIWSGFAMGRGMYLRAKRTKLIGLYA